MNRCLRILRLLEVAESPEGSKGPGMRAAVFGAFVSRVGAGTGGATLDAKWSERGADGGTLGFSLGRTSSGARWQKGWVRWSMWACRACQVPEHTRATATQWRLAGKQSPCIRGI